jgi:hypothetical protein
LFSKSNSARKRREKQPEKKRPERQIKLLGGLAAGVIGGIVATWALDKYQQGAIEATRRAEAAANTEPILTRQQEDDIRETHRAHAETAQRIVKSTLGKKLSRSQRHNAAAVIHYAAGALAGGAYGLAVEVLPVVRRGYGTGYANIIFLGGSEALLPWLGLAPKTQAQATPAGLPAPLVFGAVLESTRRVMRWLL